MGEIIVLLYALQAYINITISVLISCIIMYSHGTSSFGNRANYFSSIYASNTLTFMNYQFLTHDKRPLAYTYNHPYLNNKNSFRGSTGITAYASRVSRSRT